MFRRAPLAAWGVTLLGAVLLLWGASRPAFRGLLQSCADAPVALVLIVATATLLTCARRSSAALILKPNPMRYDQP